MELIPPKIEGLDWREVTQADVGAMSALGMECHRADGGLAFQSLPHSILERCFSDGPCIGTGAFEAQGGLVAFETVRLVEAAGKQVAIITGGVRPDWRRRGLGSYLMQWGLQKAKELAPEAIRITNESLTEPARQLYAANGFVCVMEEPVMRRDLSMSFPERPFPQELTIATWEPALAGQFFEAYQAAFRERPGFPGYTAEEWITGYKENENLRHDWSLLACAGDLPVGFVFGSDEYPGGFIVQVGVIPEWRRRGLASALIVESMRRMRAAGLSLTHLNVHLNNPGAIKAYESIGFTEDGRRARFERAGAAL